MTRRLPHNPIRAFSLIELLVVIAITAVLMGILIPTLRGARESARQSLCLSNLRQAHLACRMYADANDGYGPAIGQPWGGLPNWALVVQSEAGVSGASGELYQERSVLVCPTVDATYAEDMTRTYAMNATGHALGSAPEAANDPDSYDSLERPAHIYFDAIERPLSTPLLVDSLVAFIPDNAPPPTRSSSVLDFRQNAHVTKRLGFVHAAGRAFDAAMFDGSATSHREIDDRWRAPLP